MVCLQVRRVDDAYVRHHVNAERTHAFRGLPWVRQRLCLSLGGASKGKHVSDRFMASHRQLLGGPARRSKVGFGVSRRPGGGAGCAMNAGLVEKGGGRPGVERPCEEAASVTVVRCRCRLQGTHKSASEHGTR